MKWLSASDTALTRIPFAPPSGMEIMRTRVAEVVLHVAVAGSLLIGAELEPRPHGEARADQAEAPLANVAGLDARKSAMFRRLYGRHREDFEILQRS